MLLHGWGGSIQTMMPIFNVLKDRFRVVTLDLPGFGKSSLPEVPWNSYDYAECISKFIQQLKLKVLILFGHSHGGRISIILASNFYIVNKLILIDRAGLIPKRKVSYYVKVYWFKLLKRCTSRCRQNKQAKLAEFYKKFGSKDYRKQKGYAANHGKSHQR